ncbi:MAG: asparagine synthase [Pseudonocardiales bacterium]|nr:asparagine synthase [Pseudonocardiales bacterium]
MRSTLGPPDDGQAWFVVLPDCLAAGGIAAALGPQASQTVPYPSGRPWLMGRWAAEELVTAQVAGVAVAVIGCAPLTAAALSALARRVRTVADLDGLGAGLSGSFHLVAAIDGQVRVQGSVSGLRRVFYTQVRQLTVAADRMDVLAGLAAATLDEQWLAARLVYPYLPHPVADGCPWQEVRALAEDCYLHTAPGQPARVVPWWQPPEPVLSLAEAAPTVAQTLTAAVEARTQAGGIISCDLSGGLDSTPICFLAARGTSRLIAVTVVSTDAGHDDASWAQRAAAHLAGIEHLVLDMRRLPLMYAEVGAGGVGADEPHITIRDHAAITCVARQLVERGSRLHLRGMGGDQVLQAPPAYLHTTAWAHPRIAAHHLRARRAVSGWPLAATLRGLADRRSYQAWLRAAIDELTEAPPARGMPNLGWTPALRLPPWATPRAAEAARTLLHEAAASAAPLAPTRGQHASVEQLRGIGYLTRHLGGIMARAGLPLAAPFLDDRVVDACLRVRLHERTTPWRFKPLIVEAMRDLVPAPVLHRSTKGDFSVDWHTGLRQARPHLAALLDDLALARFGLVNLDVLRTVCLGLYPYALDPVALDRTLACEAWLRTLPSTVLGTAAGAPR